MMIERAYIEMEFVVISVELIEVIDWYVILQVLVQTDACFICPTSCHVFNCVATTSKYEHRQTPSLDQFNTLPVASDRSVVVAESIKCKRICSTLHDNCVWSKSLSHFLNDLD